MGLTPVSCATNGSSLQNSAKSTPVAGRMTMTNDKIKELFSFGPRPSKRTYQ